jgi:hypothetical protein
VIESLKPYLQVASALSEITRDRAREAARHALAAAPSAGVLPGVTTVESVAGQIGALADELVATSRANRAMLTEVVRAEVESVLSRMGLTQQAELQAQLAATNARVRELERELAVRDAQDVGIDAPPPPPPAPDLAGDSAEEDPEAAARQAVVKRAATKKAASKKAATKAAVTRAADPGEAPEAGTASPAADEAAPQPPTETGSDTASDLGPHAAPDLGPDAGLDMTDVTPEVASDSPSGTAASTVDDAAGAARKRATRKSATKAAATKKSAAKSGAAKKSAATTGAAKKSVAKSGTAKAGAAKKTAGRQSATRRGRTSAAVEQRPLLSVDAAVGDAAGDGAGDAASSADGAS